MRPAVVLVTVAVPMKLSSTSASPGFASFRLVLAITPSLVALTVKEYPSASVKFVVISGTMGAATSLLKIERSMSTCSNAVGSDVVAGGADSTALGAGSAAGDVGNDDEQPARRSGTAKTATIALVRVRGEGDVIGVFRIEMKGIALGIVFVFVNDAVTELHPRATDVRICRRIPSLFRFRNGISGTYPSR